MIQKKQLSFTLKRVMWLMKNLILFSGFMLSGPSLIMNNKRILKDIGFPFPLTLTLFTLIFSSVAGIVLVKIFKVELKNKDVVTTDFYMRKIMPIGLLTAGTIVMGMASYLFLTVSFIQMLKAFTPVMTMVFLMLFRLGTPTRKQVYFVVIICFGTAVAGAGELNFNFLGSSLMVFAQICEALKLVFTQKVLKTDISQKDLSSNRIKFSVFESLYYISPACALCVLIAAVFFEFPTLIQSENAANLFLDNVHVFVASGFLAVFTNLINWVVIQESDAVMLKLMASARNALLVLFNAFFLGEVVTGSQFFGYFIALGGFIGYNYLKINQARARSVTTGSNAKRFQSTV